MRIALAIVLGIAVLWPTAASAGRVQCDRLSHQIEHFSGMVERAREQNHPMWERKTQDHVNHLIVRRAAQCPEYREDQRAMRAFAELLRLGARAAMTYFTFGAF